MYKSKIGLVVPVLAGIAIAVGCSSSPSEKVGGTNQGSHAQSFRPGRGFMPTVQEAKQMAASRPKNELSTGTLGYYGGKVIGTPHIINIYWANGGSYQSQLDSFMQTILPSSAFSWLGEYDTNTQTIGASSYVKSIVDTNVAAGGTVDDTQIRAELDRLLAAGSIPAPDGNTLYMFFFPNGTNITAADAGSSCSSFCGYHETYQSGSNEYYYGVLPDPATCGANCDNQGGNYFADLTSVTTHELTEAITDPEVGIAIANYNDAGVYPVFPNAWTSASGEIGDLCAWQNATVDGYNIQLEWSNAANGCVSGGTTQGDGGSDAESGTFTLAANPGSGTVQAGSSTTFTISSTLTGGSADTIAFSISGLPAGVTGAFNPASTTSNGGSTTLTLSADANAASATATFTVNATGAFSSGSASASVTVVGQTSNNLVANGGFENGATGWTFHEKHALSVEQQTVHSGSAALQIGQSAAYTGYAIATQAVALPATGTSTLSFWGNFQCPAGDSLPQEYQQATVLDSSGHLLKRVMKQCNNDQTWEQTTVDLSRYNGQTVTLQFSGKDLKTAGPDFWFLDDVSVTNQ